MTKIFSESSMLFFAMLVVNAGNYAINLVLGRMLGPEAFAEVSVIATIVLILSFIAVGLQLTSAKFVAESKSIQEESTVSSWLYRVTLKSSIFFAFVFVCAAPFLAKYLKFNSVVPFLIIAGGLPFYFSMAVKRGKMQGCEDFKSLALTYVLEMSLRFVFTFILLFIFIQLFVPLNTEAVAIGFFCSFFAASFYKLDKSDIRLESKEIKPILHFVAIIAVYELSQIIINNSDVILAKHFFTAKDAGMYAAIALIGRVVFFGTWTVVTLLFPKVIQRKKEGLPHSNLFWTALIAVALAGAAIVLVCYLAPQFILGLLFGSEYLAVANLLWIYALATTLFACANVFAYYHMSLENYIPVGLTLIAGIGQLVLINLYHSSLQEVIIVQLIIMSILLVVMIAYHFILNTFLTPKTVSIHQTIKLQNSIS